MKIYKNPYVSYDSYFVKIGKASTGKMEGKASNCYYVHNRNGNWEIDKAKCYDSALKNEFKLVAENRVSIDKIIEEAVKGAVLKLIGEW